MENSRAAEAIERPVRDARGQGAIVFDRARAPQAEAAWLEPGFWGPRAAPVQKGGRGAAWFVEGPFGRAVLRHYRRGGLVARLGVRRYAWLGEGRVRSFAEFHLLSELRAGGLRVPAPLVAGYQRSGLGYRAALMVERIDGARPLSAFLEAPGDPAWAAAGTAIAALHRAGVDHADLNADNILLDGEGLAWLIDFDRGRRRPPSAGWREANLARLSRSLAKLGGSQGGWRGGFDCLRSAYAAGFEGGAR